VTGWPSGLSKRLKAVYVPSDRRMKRFMEERPLSQYNIFRRIEIKCNPFGNQKVKSYIREI
jgi:hypothetical protein